jgi:hypothetical protein
VTEPDQKKDINCRPTPAIPSSAQGQEGICPPERPARRRSPICRPLAPAAAAGLNGRHVLYVLYASESPRALVK